MNRLTCADCSTKIPNGHAHIRSVAFEQVAFCSGCIAVRAAESVIGGSLSERLERVPVQRRSVVSVLREMVSK